MATTGTYLTGRQLRRQLPLIERFKIREGRAQQIADTQSRPINPHAFQPYKDPNTGRWMPARLSLRRQAQLGKEAYREGRFEELTKFVQENGTFQSVKLEKMRQRIEELQEEEKNGGRVATLTAQLAEMSTDRIRKKPSKIGGPRKALELAKALAATRGPYVGRSQKVLFKGTKAEREAPGKRRVTAEKLSGMDKSVKEWRKTRLEARNKARPVLPF